MGAIKPQQFSPNSGEKIKIIRASCMMSMKTEQLVNDEQMEPVHNLLGLINEQPHECHIQYHLHQPMGRKDRVTINHRNMCCIKLEDEFRYASNHHTCVGAGHESNQHCDKEM
jgi:hypothetical protein